jgi:putative ABC transport system permease protein
LKKAWERKSMLASLASDVILALRVMRQKPLFTAAVVLTLALGTGANTAVYTLVHAVLLRPFPFPESERLVEIKTVSTKGEAVYGASLADVVDLRARVRSLSSAASYRVERVNLVPEERAIPTRVAHVTPLFFDVLDTKPLLGRTFLPGEDEPGGDVQKAVLSFSAWQSLYGGRREILGTTIRTGMGSYEVVGVMPSGFSFPGRTDLWIPVQSFLQIREIDRAAPEFRGFRFSYRSIARLAEGADLEGVRAEVEAVSRTLQAEFPATNRDFVHRIVTLREAETTDLRPYLLLLLGAVVLVLVICSANVANLLLSRTVSRSRELALRGALGARRSRLARQLLTESLVFAFLGAGLGVALAAAGLRLFSVWTSFTFPVWARLEIDGAVLASSFAVAFVVGILVGAVPLAHLSRNTLAGAVREGTRGSARSGFLRPALVVGEVSLSLVLLVGAGLLLSSLNRLRGVEEGLDSESVLTVSMSAFRPGREEVRIRNVTAYYRRVIEKLRELPGVVAVGGTDNFPYGSRQAPERRDYRLEIRGESEEERTHRGPTLAVDVTPEYFQAVGIPLLEGRTFHEGDNLEGPWVIILSESASKILFPGRTALGQEVRVTFDGGGGDPFARVVGIVGDVKYDKREDGGIELYYPYTQYGLSSTTLAVRVRGPAEGLAERVRDAVHSVDPETAVEDVRPMDALIDDSLWRERLWGTLLTGFATFALALAAIGLYAVLAYAVASRTREIGVRMALGSKPLDVLAVVAAGGMRLVGIGLLGGAIAAAGLLPLIRSLLFGIEGMSLSMYAIPALVLSAVALAACLMPAIRAARTDPVLALRQE